MNPQKETIFEQFLGPVFRLFLDEETFWRSPYKINWEKELNFLKNPTVTYPHYYTHQTFFGMKDGYLNPKFVLSYDQIIPYLLPPTEPLVRQGLIDFIQGQPRRILDLGCGTGTQTLMLKKTFPDRAVMGLDLSPYMLVMAHQKAHQENLNIQWRHGRGEQTGFPDASFDLITITLLFHEIPPEISQEILCECFRLLTVGGEVIVLEGNHKLLRQTEWLTHLLENSSQKSADPQQNVENWMIQAGFSAIKTQDIWVVNQVTRGVKPIPGQETKTPIHSTKFVPENSETSPDWGDLEGLPIPT